MHNEMPRRIAGVYFVTLGTLMYYFLEEGLYLPMYMSYRQLFAIIIAVSGFACFLVKPRIASGVVACKHALILSIPLLVSFAFTLLIWTVNRTDVSQITRSLSNYFTLSYQVAAAFAAAAFLYMFGEKGIWYNLLSLLLANLILIVRVMLENGVGVFMQEFVALVTSFTENTGSVIVQAEFHELAFCTGMYVLFMLLQPKKKGWFWLMFALVLFCFLAALKRIAVVPIILGALFGGLMLLLCRHKHGKQAWGLSLLLMGVCIAALLAYIYAVRAGMFDLLQTIGIDTKGRTEAYQVMEKFYDFSPSYIGQGRSFVQMLFWGNFTTGQLFDAFSSFKGTGISSLHNDFLMYYIDLGFFGYVAWLLSFTVLRVWYFGRKGHTRRGVLAACMALYVLIISTTDNTLQYPLVYMVTDILIMGVGFDEEVRAEELRLFGTALK